MLKLHRAENSSRLSLALYFEKPKILLTVPLVGAHEITETLLSRFEA